MADHRTPVIPRGRHATPEHHLTHRQVWCFLGIASVLFWALIILLVVVLT